MKTGSSHSFLYDYYYSKSTFFDANTDDYQKNYYSEPKTYNNYPYAVADKPYLIGFPGSYYYEFDLSGSWKPSNTYVGYDEYLPQQTITFVSEPGATIAVSDAEQQKEEYSGYLYCANYLAKDLAAGSYLLSAAGDNYERLDAAAKAVPFRPYFIKKTSSARKDGDVARSIIFSNDDSQMDMNTAIQTYGMNGDIIVKGGRKKITVISQMPYTIDVRIVTPAGMTLTSFTLEPSEVVETRVENGGVFIVDGEDGRHVKKVIVR